MIDIEISKKIKGRYMHTNDATSTGVDTFWQLVSYDLWTVCSDAIEQSSRNK